MVDAYDEFLESSYKTEVMRRIREGKRSILIDFAKLERFDPIFSEKLLENPEEELKHLDEALNQIKDSLIQDDTYKLKARVYNLPKTAHIKIRDIRADHLGKLIAIKGQIRKTSDVRPKVSFTVFACPVCSTKIPKPQTGTVLEQPFLCPSCGRKGKFKLESQELIDIQHIVVEEIPEELYGAEQPKRISTLLTQDLLDPEEEKKRYPGNNVILVGIVKEIPITGKGGEKTTKFEILLDVNSVEMIEEAFEEIKITKEDEKKIKELASDPEIYKKLVDSFANSIYGYEEIKEAIILQLFGGVKKIRPDGTRDRGDIHVLLVGDPGCISGNSQVALINKGMEKIQDLGTTHLQKIKEAVVKIRKNSKDKHYDFATVFHHYPKQPTLKLTTETGKEIICTYNQPFLTKYGWLRADELLPGTKIRVMPKIPNYIKKLAPTNFTELEKKSGPLKKVTIPDKFTPELASLCGYIIGDGNIHKNGYRVTCYVNNQETDLLEKLSQLYEKTFGIAPAIFTREAGKATKTIQDKNGLLRQIFSVQQMNILEINSRQVSHCLSFLANKRVPQAIFKSPKPVIAKFLSWLFEADGCAFANGRGRTAVQLKSSTPLLLRDVQLLLLYFGIHSRIVQDNLCIRRSYDIESFTKYIGFISQKKREKLERVLEHLKTKSDMQKRKNPQRYEKVSEIQEAGIRDVYDFEVPQTHTFIANGIVCHNSGKSQILKVVQTLAPKARYVVGKSTSGAGITAAVVRDELLQGWALEAGALVLANKGIALIDELDKMDPEDRSAMHEAMEQQCYLPDFEITLADGSKQKMGLLVDALMDKYKDRIKQGINCEILNLDEEIKVLTTDFESIYPIRINRVSRHIAPDEFVKITLNNGREISVTPNHPCWTIENGRITTVPAKNLKENDFFPIPSQLPIQGEEQTFRLAPYKNGPALCKFLGYHITDGCYELNRGKKNGVKFWNNDKELIDDYISSVRTIFHIAAGITTRKNQYSARVISKDVASFMLNLDKNLMEKGPLKKIPQQILKCKKEDLALLLRAIFDGDGTVVNVKRNGCRIGLVTENIELAEQVSELLLRFGILSSIYKDNNCFRLFISGEENLLKFYNYIGFLSQKKQYRLKEYIQKQKTYRSVTDIIPDIATSVERIFKQLRINQQKYLGTQIMTGHHKSRPVLKKIVNIFENKIDKLTKAREAIENTIGSQQLGEIRKGLELSALSISKKLNMSDYKLTQYEKRNIQNKEYQKVLLDEIYNMLSVLPELRDIKKLAFGKIRWAKIKSAEIIENKDIKYVYDITIEPTHSFISNNMVLHNSITISKANIQATLKSETSILGAANPKFGRFDPYTPVANQIDMPPTLINRFDLIFIVLDIPDIQKDEKMSAYILNLQKGQQEGKVKQLQISQDFLKKYIAYAKQTCFPKLTTHAIEEIQNFYVSLRSAAASEDQGVRTVPISPRQLVSLVRLAEASARVRLSPQVLKQDAERAIYLLKACMQAVGTDPETGKFDIDRIASGISAKERNKLSIIQRIIIDLETKLGKTLPEDEIIRVAESEGMQRSEIEEILESLKRRGDIYEPRQGVIQRMT